MKQEMRWIDDSGCCHRTEREAVNANLRANAQRKRNETLTAVSNFCGDDVRGSNFIQRIDHMLEDGWVLTPPPGLPLSKKKVWW